MSVTWNNSQSWVYNPHAGCILAERLSGKLFDSISGKSSHPTQNYRLSLILRINLQQVNKKISALDANKKIFSRTSFDRKYKNAGNGIPPESSLSRDPERAVITHSYSERMMMDAAHEMAAARVFLFVAGLIEKDKVQPTIMFPSGNFGCSGNVPRKLCKILINVNKSSLGK